MQQEKQDKLTAQLEMGGGPEKVLQHKIFRTRHDPYLLLVDTGPHISSSKKNCSMPASVITIVELDGEAVEI